MQAHETDLGFLSSSMIIEVPYFQRPYVWSETNWEELYDNLIDKNRSHFLGSIILKIISCESGEIPRWSVIDGQQRLTTLTILLRACYDTLPFQDFDADIIAEQEKILHSYLFFKRRQLTREMEIKLIHSVHDAQDYKTVINGMSPEAVAQVVLDSEASGRVKATASCILKCYKYFYCRLKQNSGHSEQLWETLLDEQNKILVKIDLDANENEQAIFDSTNSAGVRLTYADTIKNALFQKAMENAGSNPTKRSEIEKLYHEKWEAVFLKDKKDIAYWGTSRQLGRMSRDNLEILLHSIALIHGFYDPDKHTINNLADVYKEFISQFDNDKLFAFISQINQYANLYKKFFVTPDKSTLFSFDDEVTKLFHILNVCEVSTLHPYILKLLKDFNPQEDELPDKLIEEFRYIENFVIRHALCRVSTKNFNKVCANLLSGKTTLKKEMQDNAPFLDDNAVMEAMKAIPKNKIASLILFWIELNRRASSAFYDQRKLNDVYSLEHVMPQTWQTYWDLMTCPAVDCESGAVITDSEAAEIARQSAIYEIGNMTLLKGRLNTSLRNYTFTDKIEGRDSKKGMKEFAELKITTEIINGSSDDGVWNEQKIRARTVRLYHELIKIWPFEIK